MSNKTNDQLKDAGHNRRARRIILGINKQLPVAVEQSLHHPIPSWREAARKLVRSV